MAEAISKIIPILLLITIGSLMYHRKWLDNHTADRLKLGVIKIALPAIIFLTFKNMTIEIEYLWLSIIMFGLLCVFYFVGKFINRLFAFNDVLIPFFTTGCTFGLLGIPLFEGVFGIEHLSELSILGIGNEFFVWFVYVTLIGKEMGTKSFNRKTVIEFITSPIIIAIVAGLAINLTDSNGYFEQNTILKGLLRTLEYLASMTTPIILIIIGHGIRLDTKHLARAFRMLVVRIVAVLSIGYTVKIVLIDQLFNNLSPMFNLAYFTFLILPPPFSLAIFVGQYSSEENTAVANNAIVLDTIVCVVLFSVMVLFNSQSL
jgi:predicted permease